MIPAVSPPAELRALPIWVCWRFETVDGRRTKVPYNPTTGRRASHSDPATWVSYDQAVKVLEHSRRTRNPYSGLMLATTDGYGFIDIDKCRDPQTGALDERAIRIMGMFPTWYWEASPSGTGVHGLGRGDALPKGSKPPGGIELYTGKRFAAWTGHHLAGPVDELGDAGAALRELFDELNPRRPEPERAPAPSQPVSASDQDIINRMFDAANGNEVRALWDGDTGGYGGDHSRADAALCRFIAFYAGPDPAAIERIVGMSKLAQRKKWQDREDYRRSTIDLALSGMVDFYQWDRPHLRVVGDDEAPDGNGPALHNGAPAFDEDERAELARLRAEVAALRERNQRLQLERDELWGERQQALNEAEGLKRVHREIKDTIATEALKPLEKIVAIATALNVTSKASHEGDEAGWRRVNKCEIAREVGTPRNSVSKALDRFAHAGIIAIRTKKLTTAEGPRDQTFMRVDTTDPAELLARMRSEVGPKPEPRERDEKGRYRPTCPDCRSTRIKPHTFVCEDCGSIFAADEAAAPVLHYGAPAAAAPASENVHVKENVSTALHFGAPGDEVLTQVAAWEAGGTLARVAADRLAPDVTREHARELRTFWHWHRPPNGPPRPLEPWRPAWLAERVRSIRAAETAGDLLAAAGGGG